MKLASQKQLFRGLFVQQPVDELSDGLTDSSGGSDLSFKEAQELMEKKKKAKFVKRQIRQNISRFYYNVDVEEELAHDFNSDELDQLSEDEVNKFTSEGEPNSPRVIESSSRAIQEQINTMT